MKKKAAPKGHHVGRPNRLYNNVTCEVFTCRLPPELHQRLKQSAKDWGVVKSDLVRIILDGWLKEHNPQQAS